MWRFVCWPSKHRTASRRKPISRLTTTSSSESLRLTSKDFFLNVANWLISAVSGWKANWTSSIDKRLKVGALLWVRTSRAESWRHWASSCDEILLWPIFFPLKWWIDTSHKKQTHIQEKLTNSQAAFKLHLFRGSFYNSHSSLQFSFPRACVTGCLVEGPHTVQSAQWGKREKLVRCGDVRKMREKAGRRAGRGGQEVNKRWSSSGFYPVFMSTAFGDWQAESHLYEQRGRY